MRCRLDRRRKTTASFIVAGTDLLSRTVDELRRRTPPTIGSSGSTAPIRRVPSVRIPIEINELAEHHFVLFILTDASVSEAVG